MQPLASIVIPCYKGEPYLAEAIESCLAQTHSNLEIIVVDDASPDQCAAIAEKYSAKDSRVRLIRQPKNGGVSRAFNSGFGASRGEYLARLAQDDVFSNNAIEAMLSHLIAHPKAGLVYCDERRITADGKFIEDFLKPEPDQVLAKTNKIGLCVMWTRRVWEEVGEFNPDFDTAEDFEYWMRIRERFELTHLRGRPLLSVRQHAGMGSITMSGKQEVRAAKIQAMYSRKGWLARRKILQEGYFDAAYNYREQKAPGLALKWVSAAICNWPFSLRLYRLLGSILVSAIRS
jgi:glycosyltransferase involved in cell wall biosynthesis